MENFKNRNMKVLVTGCAGFIGFHLCKFLSLNKIETIGIDNLNSYYDVNLKYSRLNELGVRTQDFEIGKMTKGYNEYFHFVFLDIRDKEGIIDLFQQNGFDMVCHLAAQAGVRHSVENPSIYSETNLDGFLNILECCRWNNIKNLVYASTSSVYGLNSTMPLSEDQPTENPTSLYAATKKANELMAHSYSHLYNIPTIGLRFFTVYGPFGRPDMAFYKFTKAIFESTEIEVYNNGIMYRDFTYIDDIVNGIFLALFNSYNTNDNCMKLESSNLYRIYNIGNSKPILLLDYIKELEINIGKTANVKMLPMHKADVQKTWAKIDKIMGIGYEPRVDYKQGVKNFIDWYKKYYYFD
jgi:UDP-glucuronate 4-epimerase